MTAIKIGDLVRVNKNYNWWRKITDEALNCSSSNEAELYFLRERSRALENKIGMVVGIFDNPFVLAYFSKETTFLYKVLMVDDIYGIREKYLKKVSK